MHIELPIGERVASLEARAVTAEMLRQEMREHIDNQFNAVHKEMKFVNSQLLAISRTLAENRGKDKQKSIVAGFLGGLFAPIITLIYWHFKK